MNIKAQFAQIRAAAIPIVVWETNDPIATISQSLSALQQFNLLHWDIVNGLTGLNMPGKQIANDISPGGPLDTGNPTECFSKLISLPENSIVFAINSHKVWNDLPTFQAINNLRETFKANGATLVLLCQPGSIVPPELARNIAFFETKLPNRAELEQIVSNTLTDTGLNPDETQLGQIVDCLTGLSAFESEQTLSLALQSKGGQFTGIDMVALWERKCKQIAQTPGLSIWQGNETFSDIGGCDNVKGFVSRIMRGNRAPKAIVFIDEIEKALAGTQGDTSGVSQDFLGVMLSFMQDKSAAGMIFIGPPGAAKSAIAKSAGKEANIPTIVFDLGACKGSLVGQSEQRIREALGVCDAISNGSMLFIATCNSFGAIPPELKRRFTLGTFFFDLPDQTERQAIWKLYLGKYGLDADLSIGKIADDGWTGAEIKQCCDIASRLGCSLAEASTFIVPVAKSAKDTIENLRNQAVGKFISASKPGTYQLIAQGPMQRKLTANN